jgi:purine-binding chemotaxis protein CheW
MNDDLSRQLIPTAPVLALPSLDEIVEQTDAAIAASSGESEWEAEPGITPDNLPQEKYLLFVLAETKYAISIRNLLEVDKPWAVTPLPKGPLWLTGVTNLRGEIISVIDGRSFFQLPEQTPQGQQRLCVISTSDREVTTGLLVDRVEGMMYLAEELICEPTVAVEDQVLPFLRGVYEHKGKWLSVLDLDKLLHSLETSF